MFKKVILIICVLLIHCEFISAKDDDGESIKGKEKTSRQFSPLQRQVFVKWQNQYDITFENAQEENEREKIFHDNLARINAHNADPKNTYKLGLNHLTHYTPDEIISTRCRIKMSDKALSKLNEQKQKSEVNILAKRIVCYWDSKSVLRSGSARFTAENINPNLCTYINYGFIGVYPNGTVYSLNPNIDFPDNKGEDSIAKFIQLKSQKPKIRLMASVGGPTFDSSVFQQIASNPDAIAEFGNSVYYFLLKYGFDGLDFFWNNPTEQDKDSYSALINELSKLRSYYWITATINTAQNSAYNATFICSIVSFLNLLTFDYHNANEGKTGFSSPFYGANQDDQLNVNVSVNYWLSQGCITNALNVGIATYGRAFTLSDTSQTDVGAAISGSGRVSSATGSDKIPYYENCVSHKCYGWTRQFDSTQKVPYIYSVDQWISYEDQESITYKTDLILANSLGGAMIYSIDLDDFSNACCNESFPLLSHAFYKVISSYDYLKSPPIWNNEKIIYTSSTAPASVDYSSYLLPVQDQGQCGSCWAFAATTQIESMAYFGNSSYNSNLSPQYAVNCVANGNYGCNGGWPEDVFDYVKSTGGMPTTSTLPYIADQQKCDKSTPLEQFPIRDIFFNFTHGNEEVIKAQIANYGPAVVFFNVSDDFGYVAGGVYSNPNEDFTNSPCINSNHVLLLYGYGTDPNYGDYWLTRNSWGDSWGDHGSIKIARGKNTNNIGCFTIFAYQ